MARHERIIQSAIGRFIDVEMIISVTMSSGKFRFLDRHRVGGRDRRREELDALSDAGLVE
jgi:hypothetical protein